MTTEMFLALEAASTLAKAVTGISLFVLLGAVLRWKDGEWEDDDARALKVIGPAFLVALVVACTVPTSADILRARKAAEPCVCKESK